MMIINLMVVKVSKLHLLSPLPPLKKPSYERLVFQKIEEKPYGAAPTKTSETYHLTRSVSFDRVWVNIFYAYLDRFPFYCLQLLI